jgi:hypothetical protein
MMLNWDSRISLLLLYDIAMERRVAKLYADVYNFMLKIFLFEYLLNLFDIEDSGSIR